MKVLTSAFCAMLGWAFGVSAQPVVSDVAIRQDAGSCLVTVDYKLSETAIVTVDFLTNGVSIGGANFYNVAGDVHKVVAVGDGEGDTVRKIWWRADKSWSNVRLPRKQQVTARVTAWATNTPPNYMVIHIDKAVQDLPASERTAYYETADALPFPGGVTNDLCKTDYLVLRKCPAANVKFRCGSASGESNVSEAKPPHYVTLTNDFYIGVYEMTQGQYEHLDVKLKYQDSDKVVHETKNPSYFTADHRMRPVENIGMNHLRGWPTYDEKCTIESGKRKYWPECGHEILEEDGSGTESNVLWRIREITGQKFDLPTDAQWEFAARAGVGGVLPDGKGGVWNGGNFDARAARFSRCELTASTDNVTATTPPSEGGTAIVGSYEPNAWGIYDMTGNVEEMCLDNFVNYNWTNYFSAVSYVDPAGPGTLDVTQKGKFRVKRGGSWKTYRSFAILPQRNGFNPLAQSNDIGFRLCLTLP